MYFSIVKSIDATNKIIVHTNSIEGAINKPKFVQFQ